MDQQVAIYWHGKNETSLADIEGLLLKSKKPNQKVETTIWIYKIGLMESYPNLTDMNKANMEHLAKYRCKIYFQIVAEKDY